jgi:hypothetical protein
MLVYHRTTLLRMFALAIPIVVAAWLVTVPTVIVTSSFVACVVLLTAVGWVVQNTYVNAQPAASFAQAFHDADRATSPTRQGPNR